MKPGQVGTPFTMRAANRTPVSYPIIPMANNLSMPGGGNLTFVYSFTVISMPAQWEHPSLQQERYSLTALEMFPVGSGEYGCLCTTTGESRS
jgi:hypothetical protein